MCVARPTLRVVPVPPILPALAALAVLAVLAGTGCGAPVDERVPADGGAEVPPPAEPPTPAERALELVNEIRVSAGLPPSISVDALVRAAQAHAEYYIVNPRPGLSAHDEEPGLQEFTGRTVVERLSAAGYSGAAFGEVMHFVGDPDLAVRDWRDSVFHRVPLVHPNATELGYGLAADGGRVVDVMDFGRGESAPAAVVWPPDGAVDVPRSWSGNEAPQPPHPPGGFPSGPVVSLTFDGEGRPRVTRHEVLDEDNAPVPHTFLGPDTPGFGALLSNTVALYPHDPVAPGATLRVIIAGTNGFDTFEKDWSFTVCGDCP